FWVAQASGGGTQTIEWEIESGNWVMVLMNADGSAGIDASIEVGARSDLFPAAMGIVLVFGLVLLLLGAGLLLVGASGLATPSTPGAVPGSPLAGTGGLPESV